MFYSHPAQDPLWLPAVLYRGTRPWRGELHFFLSPPAPQVRTHVLNFRPLVRSSLTIQRVAHRLAVDHPDRVEKVMLLDICPTVRPCPCPLKPIRSLIATP